MKKGGLFLLCIFLNLILIAGPRGGSLAAPTVPICHIQGSGFTSPWNGIAVQVQGVVSADLDDTSSKGFFVQSDNCDANPSTSDGIFVDLGARVDLVSLGDLVLVSGTVHEDYGLTELETAPADVQVLAHDHPLPAAVELHPPFDNDLARAYFETLEGMLVQLPAARVVGPTDSRTHTWVIRSDWGLGRVFQDDAWGTGAVICVGAAGLYELPPAKVGDQVAGLSGVLGFSLGSYRVALLAEPTLVPARGSVSDQRNAPDSGFTCGTYNLNNLFDTVDDPLKDDTVLSSAAYHRKLDKLALALHNDLGEPTFLALQEVENEIVLTHLFARAVIEADYGIVWVDGPDTRSIDVAFAYRSDQVSVLDFAQYQGCTGLVDGLGPDGNRDMQNPQNAVTCDTGAAGTLDGNRLFSRPPLVVRVQVNFGAGETLPLWVIVNHWKSKREDTDYQAYTLPRRLEQAQFVANLSAGILQSNPNANLVVLGDLNDYPNSQTLQVLAQTTLRDLMVEIARPARYTYIYQGVSQVLDYVLASPALLSHAQITPQPVPINADFPYIYQGQSATAYRSSDHDPVNIGVVVLPYRVHLPLVEH